MNRINKLFEQKSSNILSIYFTAGHPLLDDTVTIIETLDKAGVDMIEVGMPFSDPVADGPTIQHSSLIALKNGMSVKKLFEQLNGIREKTAMPIILMGYLNPVLQFGIEKFCEKCNQVGIDGLILPDLPPEIYLDKYKKIFVENNLINIFLVTPQTSDERIKYLDSQESGFLYVVSSSSTTGAKKEFQTYQIDYFERLNKLKLKNPKIIGFGISNCDGFTEACKYANGAIIGSAFVKALEEKNSLNENIMNFIGSVKAK